MVAQVALQQGQNLATNILRIMKKKPLQKFTYHDKGTMATVGKRKAVAYINHISVWGFTAWFLWSFVHLMSIIGVRNKILVGLNWLWSYFTYDKGDRVIIRKYTPLSSEQTKVETLN
jgi:NADH dehydrogenase